MKSNEELFALMSAEKNFPVSFDSDGRSSFLLLKEKEFWFGLGYGEDGVLSLHGNCYDWSNAFSFTNPSVDLIHKVLNYHNKISLDVVKKIISKLNNYHNKLFFSKENYGEKENLTNKCLYWNYFPNSSTRFLVMKQFKDVDADFKKLELEGNNLLNKKVFSAEKVIEV